MDGAADDRFGVSVSVSGDVVIVGAYLHDGTDPDFGAAYIFRYDPAQATCGQWWCEEQDIHGGGMNSRFGYSVSVSGDVAIVGAYGENAEVGSARVFRWNGSAWVLEQNLVASDGSGSDEFGVSVAVSGDVAVVGSYQDDDAGLDSGSAYMFQYDPAQATCGHWWCEEPKILPFGGVAHDQFGRSVCISGDLVVVGAPGDEQSTSFGSAYAFRWNGLSWVQERKLLGSDGAAMDKLGISVFLSGQLAVVGAYLDDDQGTDSGSAYVFNLGAPIPAVSIWGIVAMFLLVIAAGTIVFARRCRLAPEGAQGCCHG